MKTLQENIESNIETCIYRFPANIIPDLSEVGGKGLSLIKGTQCGLPVPPGFILSVSYFLPWTNKLTKIQNDKTLSEYSNEQLIAYCSKLKAKASKLSFTKEQQSILSDVLGDYKEKNIFAVRSSSPEEDLDGSSFAGGYETILGVTSDNIEDAVRKVYISCLDHRVFIYKRENGFDITKPKIAVIIQQQIESEISGVGFSINPITNNFDEVVINSNWGLGETVVSGTVSPDTYIINKISNKVVDVQIGKKERSLWLNTKSGTAEQANYRSEEKTLSDDKAVMLENLIKKVEEIYARPMDTEWAFSNDVLYLLQARPITAYIPVSEEMQSNPGKSKILYQDITISVQGLEKPMSVLSTSVYNILINELWKSLFGNSLVLDPQKTLVWLSNGKIYLNLSNLLGFVSKKKIAGFLKNMDSLASQTVSNINESEYKSKNINSKKYKYTIYKILFKASPYILRAIFFPIMTHRINQNKFKEFEREANKMLNDKNLSLTELTEELSRKVSKLAFKYSAPIALSARGLFSFYKSKSGLITEEEYEKLCLALPNNVTTEMNLELSYLSSKIPENLNDEDFLNKIINNTLPSELKKLWNNFLSKYGHRCPEELDAATPRYRDDIKSLIKLIFSLRSIDSQTDKFEKQKTIRQNTFSKVYNKIKIRKGFIQAKLFKLLYRYSETFAGYRETHKFYLILVIDTIRQRVIQTAEKLLEYDRLNSIEQAFDLNIEDIEEGLKNENLNIKKIAEENARFINRLKSCPNLPTIFDSRGLIHRPPKPVVKEGEISGTSVSSGIARGPVKVMHTPTEKQFNKGDILVAKATDPAWTPLFVNASAVILEVGGLLQHGALVAREYGLPCIVGIENVSDKWDDGDMVEVDGTAGIIRKQK